MNDSSKQTSQPSRLGQALDTPDLWVIVRSRTRSGGGLPFGLWRRLSEGDEQVLRKYSIAIPDTENLSPWLFFHHG